MHYVCIALAGCAAAALLIGLVWFLADAPEEDRSYLDRPPLVLRLLWPLVQALAVSIEPRQSEQWHMRWRSRLIAAGLEYVISPAQFLACRLLASLFAAGLVAGGSAGSLHITVTIAAALLAQYWPCVWLRRRARLRQGEVLRDLPHYLDQIALGVEAGLSLSMAVAESVRKGGAGTLNAELDRYLRDVRAGRRRADALQQMAERIDLLPVRRLVASINTAERMGASLGQTLRIQADQRRIERFQRAEKLALEAPVKLLAPLILFIFPNTFVIIGFPVVMKFLHEGF